MDYELAWYEALGRMVAGAAEFEGNAAYLAVRIANPPNADGLWTQRWEQQLAGSVGSTLEAIKKAARTLTRPEDKDRVVTWVKEAQALMMERNRHVRSITVTGMTSQAFTTAPIGRVHSRATGTGPRDVATDDLISLERGIRAHALVAMSLATMVDIDRANAG